MQGVKPSWENISMQALEIHFPLSLKSASKILEEKRKDPREHWREIASAVHSAMEELEELQAKIISLENKQGGETRLNNLMFTAKEISEK